MANKTLKQVQDEQKSYFGADIDKVDVTGSIASFYEHRAKIIDASEVPEYDAISITKWQIDFDNNKIRHIGITEGCFWTDWEDINLEKKAEEETIDDFLEVE